MSSTDWIKYRIYCSTENAWKEVILDATAAPPTTCPSDTAHTVIAASADEIDRKINEEVTIKEESLPTNGYFHTYTETLVADCLSTTTLTVSKPWARSVLAIFFTPTKEHQGDLVSLQIAPDTTVGVTMAAVSVGATVISVNSTVIANVFPGFLIALTDGTNLDRLGVVNSIDRVASTVTVETPTTHSFSPFVTAVMITIEVVREMRIATLWEVAIGDSKIGGAYVPENRNIRIIYQNRSTQKVVGTLGAATANGTTVLTVSNDVFANVDVDDKLDLLDTTDNSSEVIGQVTQLDPYDNQITVSTGTTRIFAANTTRVRKVAKVITFRPEILQ